MHAVARSAKPKLSLSISTQATASTRPSLSLSTSAPRTPISPSPLSPTARNTHMNHRHIATSSYYQAAPSYAYANSSSSKSILKKHGHSSSSAPGKRLQFRDETTVHCITPIENKDDYYGSYVKMSREERRWARQ